MGSYKSGKTNSEPDVGTGRENMAVRWMGDILGGTG